MSPFEVLGIIVGLIVIAEIYLRAREWFGKRRMRIPYGELNEYRITPRFINRSK
jgi:hypothetical protein